MTNTNTNNSLMEVTEMLKNEREDLTYTTTMNELAWDLKVERETKATFESFVASLKNGRNWLAV